MTNHDVKRQKKKNMNMECEKKPCKQEKWNRKMKQIGGEKKRMEGSTIVLFFDDFVINDGKRSREHRN